MGIYSSSWKSVARSLWLSSGTAIGCVLTSFLPVTAQTLPPPPSIGSPDLSQSQPFQADAPQIAPPPQQTVNVQPMPGQPASWQTMPSQSTQPTQPFDASFSAPPTTGAQYVVVLPGNKMMLSALMNQATQAGIQQNAIQLKDAPYGPHLSIGPFVTYKEAQSVTNLLRRNGMQSARVLFIR
jgi:hypothetical protein